MIKSLYLVSLQTMIKIGPEGQLKCNIYQQQREY